MKRIPLRNRAGETVAEALVDDADYDFVRNGRWHRGEGYAVRWSTAVDGPPRRRIYMHRLLLGLERGDKREADHINRDRLDNRRANLRVVTRQQNTQNPSPRRNARSRYRGVRRSKSGRRWQASVILSGEFVHIGLYGTEEEAAEAAREFRLEHMEYAVD